MLAGILLVTIAGLLMGTGAWPMKLMKTYKFEHLWVIGITVGFILIPWTITLVMCPDAIDAYRSVPLRTIITSNLFALFWGAANLLCGMCFIRIGFALTGAIMTGLGVSLGVTIPMVFKGSGLFKNSPALGSAAGLTVLAGVACMLVAVVLAGLAGFARENVREQEQRTAGGFLSGLVMAALGGIFSCGLSLSFVYSQGPIVQAMKARGAVELPANFAVWAVGLMAGSVLNIGYPVFLIVRDRSWAVFAKGWREAILPVMMAVSFCVSVATMGRGMLLLGALGASVGFGIQQATQMLGSQGVGFISGEWRGIHGRPRNLMYGAIALLLAAAIVMAYGNSLAK